MTDDDEKRSVHTSAWRKAPARPKACAADHVRDVAKMIGDLAAQADRDQRTITPALPLPDVGRDAWERRQRKLKQEGKYCG